MNRITKAVSTTVASGVLAVSTFGLGNWLMTMQNASVQCFPGILVDATMGNVCLGVESAIAGLAVVSLCVLSMIRVRN